MFTIPQLSQAQGTCKTLSFDGTDYYEIYFFIFSFTDDSISAAMEIQLSDFPSLSIMGVSDETQADSQYSEFHKMETWGPGHTIIRQLAEHLRSAKLYNLIELTDE